MKTITLFLALTFYALTSVAQEADIITGIWWNNEKTSKIEIIKKDGKYIGTIVYIIPERYKNGHPPKDKNNPDELLRDRSLLGLQILKGFVYNSKKKEWKDGTIYDPNSGNTYDCYAWLDDKNVLKLKGFIAGIRLLGRSTEWERVK
ncbi:MAG: SIGNAL peptide protein [Draconibacterium sp.]|nr:MAG: SIGNAL peptide protein [Draconibacterium sp.]